jgi:hypothetical protein
VIWAKGFGVSGDIAELIFTDSAGRVSTARTRLTAAVAAYVWRPIGQVLLGGFRTGDVGTQAVTAKINSGAVATPTSANLRLFRKSDETDLIYLDGISATNVEVATPSVALPRGGIWANGVTAFHKAVTWSYPSIVLPRTSLYIEANSSDTLPVTTTMTYYPRSHTYSAL